MEGDAEEWVFKGEGNANIVFAYRGPDPDLVRAPIRPEEIGGLTQCLNADGELRTLPGHLQNGSSRLSGLDGFFVARLVRL